MIVLKEWLRERAPSTFGVLRDAKDRLAIELRVLKQLRPRDLATPLISRQEWRRILPLQKVTSATVESVLGSGLRTLLDNLTAAGLEVREGGHSVYLPPTTWRQSPLKSLALGYPADAGLKIMRNTGGVDDAEYLVGDHHSYVQKSLTYGHRQLSLAANLLYARNLGPRLYDLVEVNAPGARHVGYVVQHSGDRVPTEGEWRTGIAKLKALQSDGTIAIVIPDGFNHPDFASPDCGGNAWMGETGSFQYVDFQNFIVQDYGRHLREVARTAGAATHFGDASILRGGRYLYQSVPGSGLPAKRNVESRMKVIEPLLSKSNCELNGRVVLDIGCNIGMMLAQYLRLGASWAHGWDMEAVTPQSERVLLALGCTRFSLTGGLLSTQRDMRKDLPAFIEKRLDGCVISYLAVRGHLGWIDALSAIPWGHLLYEGHEGETEADALAHLEALRRQVPCETLGTALYRDGDSDMRVVALLRRTPAALC